MERKHIMVVDDDPSILRLLVFVLEKKGYRISTADNGRSALQGIEEYRESGEPVELLVTDMYMPDMSGFELIGQLRNRGIGMPVLVMTADYSIAKRNDFSDDSGVSWLQKPFQIKGVMKSIEGLLIESDLKLNNLPAFAAVPEMSTLPEEEENVMTKKIVVVNDVKLLREIGKELFERRGYKVLLTNNSLEALEIIQKEKPALILLDHYMPEMNGDELCRIIKDNPKLSHIPVIIAITVGHPGEKEKCIEAGCNDCIIKPYEITALLEKLTSYLPLDVRQGPRFDIDGDVCSFKFQNKTHIGDVLNISQSGICIETEKLIPVGSRTALTLPLPNSDINIYTKAEIVRAVELEDESALGSKWKIGIKFCEISAPSELRRELSVLASA